MKCNLDKKIIVSILIGLWFIFSVGYIGWDLWDDFRVRQLTLAIEQSRVNTINQIIQQTVQGCEPLRLFSEETEVNLINTTCLEQGQKVPVETDNN